MTTNDYVSIFISYASEDSEKVHPFYPMLTKAGAKVWMDKENLLPGQDWEFAIRKAIRDSDFFLIFLTNNSVTKRGFLQKEIKVALDVWDEKLPDDVFLIPIRLDDCVMPDSLVKFQRIDIFNNQEINQENSNFTKLIEGIVFGAEKLGKKLIQSNNDYQLLTKRIQEISRTKYFYEIEVTYPQLESLKQYSYDDVNNFLCEDINDVILDFRTYAIEESGSRRKLGDINSNIDLHELWINHEIHWSDNSLLSLEYSIFTLTPTMAHPNWGTITYNLKLPDLEVVRIQDLFRQKSNYLDVISELCIKELREQTGEHDKDALTDFVLPDLGSVIEILSDYYLTEKYLVIVFHSRVWPHALGRKDVQIPYSKLAGLISETSVISRFLHNQEYIR